MARRTSPSFDHHHPEEAALPPRTAPDPPDIEALALAPRADPLSALIDQLGNLSTVDPRVALRQPLAQLVAATLDAACTSPHSRRAYESAIGLFLEHLDRARGDRLPDPYANEWRPFVTATLEARRKQWLIRPPALVLRALVDPSVLDGFRQWRLAQGDASSTINQREHAVRSFLAVAYRDGILTHEQAQALNVRAFTPQRKQVRKPVGRRLSGQEVRALRAAVKTTTRKGKRDLAILDLMLFLGLRREEVVTLGREDFVLDHGRWWLSLIGKGRQERKLKLPDALLRSLLAWFQTVGFTIGEGAGPLFCAVNRGDRVVHASPINPSVVSRLVAEYGFLAAIASRHGSGCLAPHDLRRTAARTAYDQGASLLQVQQMLGHASSETTERYIGTLDGTDDTATDHIRY